MFLQLQFKCICASLNICISIVSTVTHIIFWFIGTARFARCSLKRSVCAWIEPSRRDSFLLFLCEWGFAFTGLSLHALSASYEFLHYKLFIERADASTFPALNTVTKINPTFLSNWFERQHYRESQGETRWNREIFYPLAHSQVDYSRPVRPRPKPAARLMQGSHRGGRDSRTALGTLSGSWIRSGVGQNLDQLP